ncbi:MAG TPA: tetratricopeptide repeat protein [Candidatus Deferrimicrobium sp.]|nr:tetratricopeptide repeat protein [Candidatus Deferrimicrobium sp.]
MLRTSRSSKVAEWASAVALTLIALYTGCSSPRLTQRVADVKVSPGGLQARPVAMESEQSRIDPRAYHFFVNAVLYEQLGHPFLAATNYRQALQYCSESYEIRFSLARTLYQLQMFSDGLATLAEIKPQDAEVWRLRADMHRAIGAEDSSRAAYLTLVTIDPDNSEAFAFLAGAYRKLENLDSAIWAYENLTRLNPDQFRLWTELARLQAEKGDYAQAKESLWKSVKLAPLPANVPSYLALAEVYRAMNQADSSIVILKLALEIDKDNIVVHRHLRDSYISVDSLDAALPHAQKEVALSPLDRVAVRRLAALYFVMDSLNRADSVFSYLVDSGDRHFINHYYLGRIALRQKDLPRARDQFETVTTLVDTSYEAWLDLGYAYRQLGQLDRETETYLTGLMRVPEEQGRLRLMFALGAAYERRGQIEESVTIFEELIAQAPDFDQALNYLGYLLADRGERLVYARDLIARAVAIDPDNAAYLDSYGWVFFRLGELQQALTYLRKAATLDSDPVMFDHLGDACMAAGETEQARIWWNKALELDHDNERIKEKLAR